MRATAWATATVALLALWLASMVGAGTAEDPEITDAAGDHLGPAPGEAAGTALAGADIVAVWIGNETETGFLIFLQSTGNVGGGSVPEVGEPTTFYAFNVSFASGGSSYAATALTNAADGPVPGGVADNASADGMVLTMHVPWSAIGNPPAGASLTNLTASSTGVYLALPQDMAEDTAPDEGFGRDYVLTRGGGQNGTTSTTTSTSSTSTTSTTTSSTTTSGTTTSSTTTSGTTTSRTTTTGGPDDEDTDLVSKLLDENQTYFFAAVGLGVLLIILAAFGLKRWSL